ncbi:MAG: hypothetical protein KA714_26070 [Limnoraphis sp. WC205]|nr:hypothetical protein [Limnoraphis sp. WC205]
MTSSDSIDQRLSAIETEMTQLREGQQTLSSQLENLTRISMSLVEVSRSQQQQISVLSQQADRDRVAWQEEMRQVRADIRQIWEYLLRQRPNGGSSS